MRNVIVIAALIVSAALWDVTDASAHRSTFAPVIHEIDHLHGQTNEIRRELGRAPIRTDFAYRNNGGR